MNIELTSIHNKEVNLNLEDLKKMLTVVIYPAYLQDFDRLYIMVVCVKNEIHQHEAYMQEELPYISIALDYHEIIGLASEEVTVICKNRMVAFLNSLSYLKVRELA